MFLIYCSALKQPFVFLPFVGLSSFGISVSLETVFWFQFESWTDWHLWAHMDSEIFYLTFKKRFFFYVKGRILSKDTSHEVAYCLNKYCWQFFFVYFYQSISIKYFLEFQKMGTGDWFRTHKKGIPPTESLQNNVSLAKGFFGFSVGLEVLFLIIFIGIFGLALFRSIKKIKNPRFKI